MSFFSKSPKPNDIDNWVCVLEGSTDLEIEMAKNYLSNLKIPSNILSKRDSAYSLNVSEMAMVYLYVPKEFEKKARKALEDLEEENPDFNPDTE
ncbi:MAG: DUF2007 domain-containing protein [Gracilimonas sp.]|uniref:DUF2007 domain-containing protein n=1 Tax=Gracilimonas sediminicola TaxID=2952158 RepID=A0A9X2L2J2_9BACT|nr:MULTISPECIES: DUF2007 domain-containing protein [Gracilimonas]MBO6587412.1 DUF2007 domain-containing protein [Gracilimonas sp.]MBO6614102.1 DUF2007 domain-containing protein [Gracilimonas sp.]MCP9290853.1 DUF2007 domain-containing protein [Gracilimonas sediminicola]